MRSRDRVRIATVGTCLALLAGAGSTSAQTTIALVPTVVVPAGDAFKLDTGSVAALTFDLRPIPRQVTIQSVTLRLVHAPSGRPAQSQAVRISNDDGLVGRLTVETANPAGESLRTADGLSNALRGALERGAQTLTLSLSTRSPDTEFSYHSVTADTTRNRPRLIVSWEDTAAPVGRVGAQLRYRGNPDDVTPWKNDAPTEAVMSRVGFGPGVILAGPVFRGDEILLIATTGPPASSPTLFGLDWNGNQRWSLALPALGGGNQAAWKYLHVDEQNRVLAFANDGTIRLFDDFHRGPPAAPQAHAIQGMLLSRRPAVSAGGMITFLNDNGYVYALSPAPGFDELWRSDVNVGKAPPPALSPRHGDGLAYTIDQPGKRLLAIDAARGDVRFWGAPSEAGPLARSANVRRPLVVEGQDHDWVLLSGFGDGGLLWGYTNFTAGSPDRWRAGKDGPVSRCVAPPTTDDAGPVIYCVQGGKFMGFRRDGASHCVQPANVENLEATSNLVADGAGNVYFWNETVGNLYGFDSRCGRFLIQGLQGLPTQADGSDFELHVGPNGVMYVTSTTELFAIQPTRSGPPGALVADTRYTVRGPLSLGNATAPTDGPVSLTAIGGELSLGNLQVPPGADVTCSAGSGVSLGKGFKVAKGGVLRCGIRAFVPTPN